MDGRSSEKKNGSYETKRCINCTMGQLLLYMVITSNSPTIFAESQEQHMETAGQRSVSSQAKDVSSSMPVTGELGGLSEAEKQRLVAQYDCESDGNSEYPYDVCGPTDLLNIGRNMDLRNVLNTGGNQNYYWLCK